jgi:hypothetical protein
MLWVCSSAPEAVAVTQYLIAQGLRPQVRPQEPRPAAGFLLPARWAVVVRGLDSERERRLRAQLRCLSVPGEW